ncbi:hypothetical protein ACIQ2D_15230 [Lysinibacillus sp. NPDC097287]|uniref:hypothetical protein n=1 Tax=Lysinibacillus sp. NPDC097287 TaxID=3364144 RepID=UPI003811AA21
MKLKHLGISALALGLLVGGGASLSAFASENSEENTVLKSEVKLSGVEHNEFNGQDELPEGVVRMDKVQLGETDSDINLHELNGTGELPEGVIQMDEVKIEGADTKSFELNGQDELPEGVTQRDEVKIEGADTKSFE